MSWTNEQPTLKKKRLEERCVWYWSDFFILYFFMVLVFMVTLSGFGGRQKIWNECDISVCSKQRELQVALSSILFHAGNSTTQFTSLFYFEHKQIKIKLVKWIVRQAYLLLQITFIRGEKWKSCHQMYSSPVTVFEFNVGYD